MNKRIPLLLLGLSLLTVGCAKKQSEDNKKPSSLIPDSNTGEVLPPESDATAAPISIPDEFTELEISDERMFLNVGGNYEFSFVSSPTDSEGVIQLKTENASIVRVEGNWAYAVAYGETRVYYETPGGLKSYCSITVLQAAPNVATFTVKEQGYFEEQWVTLQQGTLSNMHLSFDTPSPVEPILIFNGVLTKTRSLWTDNNSQEIAKEMSFGYRLWRFDNGAGTVLDEGTVTTDAFKTGQNEQVTLTFDDIPGGVVGDSYTIQFSNV